MDRSLIDHQMQCIVNTFYICQPFKHIDEHPQMQNNFIVSYMLGYKELLTIFVDCVNPESTHIQVCFDNHLLEVCPEIKVASDNGIFRNTGLCSSLNPPKGHWDLKFAHYMYMPYLEQYILNCYKKQAAHA